jgi:hypothetical protein
MRESAVDSKSPDGVDAILGYLNFASGAYDAVFFSNLNQLFDQIKLGAHSTAVVPWAPALTVLKQRLVELEGRSAAFRDAAQAKAILEIASSSPSVYWEYHRGLQIAMSEQEFFNSFLLGRFFEAALREFSATGGAPLTLQKVFDRLDDYVGYRPTPALENRRLEPHRHERFRPVPIYLRNVGPAIGPWSEVVSAALQILSDTSAEVRRLAYFDLEAMDELAIDFRGYDFDHPANKRPNYQFGMWDPHQIGLDGRYHRFIVQHVTLHALMSRAREAGANAAEMTFEAGAVLAGTILMASGISGDSPDSFDSTVSIATLLPRITNCRDKFYEQLMHQVQGEHGLRLREEAKERRQPFGSARQQLNAQLANRRARQMECSHLARIYARIGQLDAAKTKAEQSQSASSRVLCQIDGLLTECRLLLARGELAKAAELPEKIRAQLKEGIECGAIVDPWSILGFSANYSLFASPMNATHDHRVDELIDRMEQLLSVYSRLWTEAAARSEGGLAEKIGSQFRSVTDWWRQFAAHEVGSVEAADPLNIYQAAEHVGQAIRVWREGGAAAGDVAFWAPYADMFDTPKAYALVVEALLERGDLIASMALLMHWLSSAQRVPLEQSDSSFHALAERWLFETGHRISEAEEKGDQTSVADFWRLLKRFVDSLEVNADEYWHPPQFELGGARNGSRKGRRKRDLEADDDGDNDSENVVSAAYENMLFTDSTDDGVEGNIADDSPASDLELGEESKRISDRLAFLSTMARLWKHAGVRLHKRLKNGDANAESTSKTRPGWSKEEIQSQLAHWAQQAIHNRQGLTRLLDQISDYKLPKPRGDQTSLVEYDQRRLMKESLLERAIGTMVETADAERLIQAAAEVSPAPAAEDPHSPDSAAVTLFSLLLSGNTQGVVEALPRLLESLSAKPLLYVPLSRGGDPKDIVAARIRQRTLHDLLVWLPRLGLLTETCRLVEMAREMERNHPVGAGAITEYDELFRIGYRALVESIVSSSQTWDAASLADDDSPAQALVSSLEQLTEALLTSWLAHSRTLRLSVLEKAKDKKDWQKLVAFIEKYGGELFTQPFLNLGNLRAILHQGVDQWLLQLQEEPDGVEEAPRKLLADLEDEKNRKAIVEQLSLVLEAVIENYDEYRDYNSSTTNSDRGEMLYMLLDFLRLRGEYERISWNLRPVILAHEILVRRDKDEAAAMWRRSLNERISEEADRFMNRFAELQKKYSMRMQSIADRLSERFVRPLTIDSLKALVAPAIDEARGDNHEGAFDRLQQEVEELGRGHPGAGLNAPSWISALDDELDRCTRPAYEDAGSAQLLELAPRVLLGYEETQRQLDEWSTRE